MTMLRTAIVHSLIAMKLMDIHKQIGCFVCKDNDK